MDIGQSHLTDVGSSVKIKMIKNLKTPLQSVFPLMGSSGGSEIKQK